MGMEQFIMGIFWTGKDMDWEVFSIERQRKSGNGDMGSLWDGNED